MKLLARRRVLWDYLGGALWVLPTLSVLVFLLAGALGVLLYLQIAQALPL